jgi:HAMP domain-containing protein
MQEKTLPSKSEVKSQATPVYISLRVKLLVFFILLYALVFGGVSYWFYNFATDRVRDRLEEDLDTVLMGMAEEIDGDQFAALVEAGRAENPTAGYYPPQPEDDDATAISALYWGHAAFLYQQRQIIGDERVRFFTYVLSDTPGEVIFIGSSSALADPPGGAQFFARWSPDTADDFEILRQGTQKKTFFFEIYEDDFGEWISGYAPITDSDGNTVGAVGVDFLASYVREVQNDVQDGITLATGITSIAVIVMVTLIAGLLTRPVVALTRSAERIGEGDYDQDLSALTPGRTTDEIGKLAQVFEIMVGKVRQREEKLKKQVSDLQIMIDESKRQEQVDEIVDSDFFRDLQTKAKEMRAGFGKKPPVGSGTPAADESADEQQDESPPESE